MQKETNLDKKPYDLMCLNQVTSDLQIYLELGLIKHVLCLLKYCAYSWNHLIIPTFPNILLQYDQIFHKRHMFHVILYFSFPVSSLYSRRIHRYWKLEVETWYFSQHWRESHRLEHKFYFVKIEIYAHLWSYEPSKPNLKSLREHLVACAYIFLT